MVKQTRVKGHTLPLEKLTAGIARLYGLAPRLQFDGESYLVWKGFHTKPLADKEAEESRKSGWKVRVVFRTGRGKIKGYYLYRRRK